MRAEMDKVLYCNFCGLSSNEVRCLIAGPDCHICDDCVQICQAVIERHYDYAALEYASWIASLRPSNDQTDMSEEI